MDSPSKVKNAFQFLKYEAKERLLVVNLTNRHAIMNFEVVVQGTVNQVSLRVSEILRTAVIINAPAIILVDNHPAGDPTPSKEDIRLTQRVIDAAKMMEIRVLDHLIVGEEGTISLAEQGLLMNGESSNANALY